jgi:hypothetical protein
VSLAALIRLRETVNSRLHLTAGLSLPLGDTDAAGVVLAPTGMRPTLRLPYPMQLGSGTYDILAGVTYSRFYERWSWGAQWRTVVTTGDNDESYAFGNEHRVTAWYARPINSNLSWSARMEWIDRGNVDGIDPLIVAPVQTADPLKQRASRIDLALGINYVSTSGHRVSLEVVAPVQERLDGPQLKTDWQVVGGYQVAF